MKDWQIAEAAEATMKPISKIAAEMGYTRKRLFLMGNISPRLILPKCLTASEANPGAKYIDVTAITPTPLGEGKTTTTIGLIEGLGQTGQTRYRRDTPAKRRTDIQCQRFGGRRRTCPVHSACAVFDPAYRRYRFDHQCAQSMHGRADRAYAA